MNINRYSLGSNDTVTVSEKVKGNCCVRGCKKRTGYMVFGDDGAPKMSRLHGQYCALHLYKGVQSAWNYNHKNKKRK